MMEATASFEEEEVGNEAHVHVYVKPQHKFNRKLPPPSSLYTLALSHFHQFSLGIKPGAI